MGWLDADGRFLHEVSRGKGERLRCGGGRQRGFSSLSPHCLPRPLLPQSLLPNLQHQHSRVRLSVIEALGALVSRGCVPPSVVEATVVPALRAITYDRAPAVREAVFVAAAAWLGFRGQQDEGSGPAEGTTEASSGRASPQQLPK